MLYNCVFVCSSIVNQLIKHAYLGSLFDLLLDVIQATLDFLYLIILNPSTERYYHSGTKQNYVKTMHTATNF